MQGSSTYANKADIVILRDKNGKYVVIKNRHNSKIMIKDFTGVVTWT